MQPHPMYGASLPMPIVAKQGLPKIGSMPGLVQNSGHNYSMPNVVGITASPKPKPTKVPVEPVKKSATNYPIGMVQLERR